MTGVSSSRIMFLIAVVAGVSLWAVFAGFNTEPWDSLYGWIAVSVLGFAMGYFGKGNPGLWPLGLFLGSALTGLGAVAKSFMVGAEGGVNFFFPLGLVFLVAFMIPALIGSLAGYGLRRMSVEKPDRDT